jgi:hypothetical protein
LNGKEIEDLHVTINYTGKLENIKTTLDKWDIGELSDHICA